MHPTRSLSRTLWLALACAIVLAGAPLSAQAAQTVHLFLSIGGQVVEGESTLAGLENTIECYSLSETAFTPVDTTGTPRGARQHRPVRIVKPVDKSTPLLFEAWRTSSAVDYAEFRFYRPNPQSGAREHYFTIRLEGGFVSGVAPILPDVLDPSTTNLPASETVSFVFQTIRWTHEPSGTASQDSWRSN